MKNLARHIELLLRDNDCVILPGFGGFIAHEVPAYYVGEDSLYYPPSRNISFNAAITMNDGLLAQSYMKSYQVDYARANYMIDIAVEHLLDTLDEEGAVTLPRVGTITQDIHQSLQFTPDAAGIASPIHFGLSSFAIKELSQLRQSDETSHKQKGPATRTAKVVDLHINREMLHHMMSTAAAILLLLMIALPTGHHQPTDIAALNLKEIIATPQHRLVPQETTLSIAPELGTTSAITEDIVTEESPAAVPATAPVPEEASAEKVTGQAEATPAAEDAITVAEATIPTTVEEPQPTTAEIKSTKTYHIIVASLPNHRGADEVLAQYMQQGYTDVSLVERDDRVRISLAQFADKNEANEYLKVLRNDAKFATAWLLAVRNN